MTRNVDAYTMQRGRMDENRIAGTGKNFGGRAQELRSFTGDKTQAEGLFK